MKTIGDDSLLQPFKTKQMSSSTQLKNPQSCENLEVDSQAIFVQVSQSAASLHKRYTTKARYHIFFN